MDMSEARGQCPAHEGDTGGTDSYFWNPDKEMGHCKSCDLKTWVHKGILWGKRSRGSSFKISGVEDLQPEDLENDAEEEEDTLENEEPEANTPKGYSPWRGVKESTLREFDVVSTKDRIVFKYPSGGCKTRMKDKKEFFSKGIKADELFGMSLFPAGCSKKVTITEGEMDALSAWQMLQSGRYMNPVVSLPGSSPSGKLWEKCKGWLDSFETIVLSLDNDEPGRKAAEKISLMFPGKVVVMDHGKYKDANDFLVNGQADAFKSAWWAAKKFRPDDMLVDEDDYLNLYDDSPDFEYFPTGIPELDEKILGINKGYFTVIQAPTGVGKSEFMRYLEWQCLQRSDFKFAYMHLEESRLRSLLGLVSYQLGENVTIKKFIEEKGLENEVREAISTLVSSERMVQFTFSPEDGYETLIDKIKYLVAAFDIDFVFFEPIQDLVQGEDKEGKLADLASRLGTLASDIDVGIVTIAHQNQNGDTMYATMIGKKAAFEITLHRDPDAEDPAEANRTQIKVGRKNRVGLGSGPAGRLDFDVDSYTLTPVLPPAEPKRSNKDDEDDF